MKFKPLPSGYVINLETVAFIGPGKQKNRINVTFSATFSKEQGAHPLRLALLAEDSLELLKQLEGTKAFNATKLKSIIEELPESPK
jgi:hypothetical protein